MNDLKLGYYKKGDAEKSKSKRSRGRIAQLETTNADLLEALREVRRINASDDPYKIFSIEHNCEVAIREAEEQTA